MDSESGLLDSVPRTLPALEQAQQISAKAIAAGFIFADLREVWSQVYAEIAEFNEAQPGTAHATEEFGDILFSLVNVANNSGFDAEGALRITCDKFRRRWAIMEASAQSQGKTLSELDISQLEELWQSAKIALKEGSAG